MVRSAACQAGGSGRLPRGHHSQTHDGTAGGHHAARLTRRTRGAPQRDERSPERTDTRAGHDARTRETKAGAVTLQVPKPRRLLFETAMIKRYRCREAPVEEAPGRPTSKSTIKGRMWAV